MACTSTRSPAAAVVVTSPGATPWLAPLRKSSPWFPAPAGWVTFSVTEGVGAPAAKVTMTVASSPGMVNTAVSVPPFLPL